MRPGFLSCPRDPLGRGVRYPEVIVGDGGFGTVQARIPELNGEIVITRYTLRELQGQARRAATVKDL